MNVDERLRALVANLPNVLPTLQGELGSKAAITHALVLPLIAALGYEVLDPGEVARGGGVDFTILRDGAPALLVEVLGVLEVGASLGAPTDALARAHASTPARAAIVTDGVVYCVYADTRASGVLDDEPARVFDLRASEPAARELLVHDLARLSKASFDLDALLAAARLGPRVAAIEAALRASLAGPDPDPELVALLHRRVDRPGALDSEFTRDVASALARLRVSPVRARAGAGSEPALVPPAELAEVAELAEAAEPDAAEEDGAAIVTTEEELAGYALVRELVGDIIPLSRLGYRDRRRFFGIILDGDERKTLCRLHFNRVRKYVGIFDGPTREKKRRVANVEAIVELREPLREAARRWTDEGEPR